MPARLLNARFMRRAAYVALLAVLAVSAIQAYQDLQSARRRSADLDTRITTVSAEIERLERANEAIESDPATVERVARRQLGLVREGEVVIVLPATGESAVESQPSDG